MQVEYNFGPIMPIFKRGTKQSAINYGGITLLNTVDKIMTQDSAHKKINTMKRN